VDTDASWRLLLPEAALMRQILLRLSFRHDTKIGSAELTLQSLRGVKFVRSVLFRDSSYQPPP